LLTTAQLQEAISQAAERLGTDETTQLYDCESVRQAGGSNPLSLILGYTDDGEDEEGESDKDQLDTAAPDGRVDRYASSKGFVCEEDDPLVGFLTELQNEGLLDEGDGPDVHSELSKDQGNGVHLPCVALDHFKDLDRLKHQCN
jgi:hypothetical protein